jgi:hypothetical protein
MKTISLARAVALIPILALAAAGQEPLLTWENVKMLAPGTQIRIASGKSKPAVATLESVTDSELVTSSATGPRSFQRAEIASVSVKLNGHRRRNTIIGLAVGALAGAAIGAGIGRAQENNCAQKGGDCSLDLPGGAGVGGVIGLIAGTVTGLVWPTGGWRKVYAP